MEDFEKLKVLGAGSYGTVYLATSAAPNAQLFAIKSSTSERSKYLKKEETILKSLVGCPEIIQCYGIQITEENGDSVYNLQLEYAPHGSLHELIDRQKLTERQAKVYIRMILKGLRSIHEKGLVHCDLKPGNILLFPPKTQASAEESLYQAKIADFGLAKTKEEKIDSKVWIKRYRGTPEYMSPESVALGRIDEKLDIWSLGCIVIEMLTAESAWEEYSDDDTLMSVLASVSKIPEIPNEFSGLCKDFIRKCLRMDPRERWTADMLLNHPFLIRIHDPFL